MAALRTNSTGNQNTATGANALYYNTAGNNTANGFAALQNNTTGSGNVALGYQAGLNIKAGANNIILGANVLGTATDANVTRIGNTTQKKTFIGGIYNIAEPVASGIKPVYINSTGQLGTTPPASSARFKDAIEPMDKSSEAILKFKPVTFRYKNDAGATPQFGLIAEEVAKVNPDLVLRDEQGEIYTVRYEAVNAMLLNEFLKEHRRVKAQEDRLAKQESLIAKQQKQIEALSTDLQKINAEIELRKPSPRVTANR
jgi:hypothetical protein